MARSAISPRGSGAGSERRDGRRRRASVGYGAAAAPQTRRARRGGERDQGAGVSVSALQDGFAKVRSEEHTSELQSLMRISYAVFCLKKKTKLSKIYRI